MGKKTEARDNLHLFPDRILVDSSEMKGRWHETFGRKAPLHLDVGMGFGRFLVLLAERHPEENFLGLERHPHRVMDALNAARSRGLENIRFICGEVNAHLFTAFAREEVDSISLFFPDPWPEGKKIKHRLTFPPLVEGYHAILKPGGTLAFRSDHPRMADYSRNSLLKQGFEISKVEEGTFEERLLTDFELRYLEEGKEIHAFLAIKKAERND